MSSETNGSVTQPQMNSSTTTCSRLAAGFVEILRSGLPVLDATSVIATASRFEFQEGSAEHRQTVSRHSSSASACSSVDKRQRARITSYGISPSRFVRR